ncbi:MAG: hypothetical protein PWP21_152 [Thermosediminibacterales bacterium]|nr:hypothetical protein [Thermosediminibacterales bacterium]
MRKKVVVIGGGAAGMIAAGRAASLGSDTLLLEKNNILGKKLLITGKGRCNITNSGNIRELIENIPGNGKFLYSAFNYFSNKDLIKLLESLGLKVKYERGKRVFPITDRSKDVVNTLISYLKKNNVKVHTNKKAEKIKISNGKILGVETSQGEFFKTDSIIIATGGMSYPATGSTGDGYRMAKELGHTIIPLKPSLVPLTTKENWVKNVQGLTLKNVKVSAFRNNHKISEEFGEMLFTHFGVSGPVILTMSRDIVQGISDKIKISIDLKPALNESKLDTRLQRDFKEFDKRMFKNSLTKLLPKSLIPIVIKLSDIPPNKKINQITKQERLKLIRILKGLELNINGYRPIEEAIVTSGGVSVKEINPKTMESKLIKGLFFAGEVIDVDGLTGGFNLQAAFSTGFVAGSFSSN